MAAALLACPACGRLRYADRLKALAAAAGAATAAHDTLGALTAWREALDLLPPDSRQHAVVAETIAELSKRIDAAPNAAPAPPKPKWASRGGVLGAIGLVIWKLKFVLVLLLTKGKLLLLGLTKGSTLFSMLFSLSIYWRLFGWKWAVGVVVSIYIHEMGHVAALRRFGIPATAPMFIPGFGAMIRSRFYPKEVVAQARVGLAGPFWGLGAAFAAYLVFLATHAAAWGALAEFGAWLNLFNLLPVWQLDGAHGFRALTRTQRWIAVAVLGVVWALTAEGLLLLLMIGAAAAALTGVAGIPPERPDRRTLLDYAFLVAALGALTTIPVPLTALR